MIKEGILRKVNKMSSQDRVILRKVNNIVKQGILQK